jgi:tetratricopeptide (TPR) repeat protein
MGNGDRAWIRRTLKAVLHPLAMHRESKVYTRPTSEASSKSIAPSRLFSGISLLARFDFSKARLVYVFVLVACGVNAQTYNVGPDSSNASKPQTKQTQSPDQPLGWGSNIQNARLARAAQLALQQGNHALALDYAQRAAQAAPNDPQLWFLLGYAARLSGKYPQSADAYDRGLRLSPSAIDGLSGLAQTYSLMGRVEDAERLLKQAIASDPRRSDDALLLGDLYMRSADYTEALDWLGKAERIRPGVRSELLMALCYQHLKQMDLANQYLELAKQHAPDNSEVQRTMAGYYRDAGNFSEAIAALRSIRKPKPDVIAELAYTFQLDGKLDDSARLYEQAANVAQKDLGLQLSAAQAKVAIGSIDEANSFLDRAATLNADYYRLHEIRGEIAKLQEREPEAISEYAAALANLPASPAEGALYGIQLHLDLMEIYRNLADNGAAQNQLRIAQSEISAKNDLVSSGAQFLRLRALIKMNANDPNGALTDVTSALAINAHDRDDLQLDGDILVKLGRIDDAIAVYKQVLAIDSVNQFALTSLGYASRAAGRDQDAEEYFQRLAQAAPKLFIPYLALGDLYTARRDFPPAAASYAKAYALAPRRALIVAGGMNAAIEAHDLTLAATWMSRATSEMDKEPQVLREKERYLSFKGDYQQSADVGREAVKVLPRDRDVIVYLGYDLLHLGLYDELLALTSKNLSVLPKEPDIPLLEGYVHKHQGLSDQARKDFTEALNRDPEVVTAYVNRGYMLNDLGQPLAASADFESALKREPDNGEAHLGLAYASLDLHKPQVAVREAELAEHTLGDSRDIHVIRATAYGRQDMLNEAASEYKAALKFTPNDGALHLGLGNTYFAERQYHDAIDELEIATKDSPDNAAVYALLARSYANLQNRDQALQYVQLAESHSQDASATPHHSESTQSEIFVSTGEALSTLGDQAAAMERFRKALDALDSDRVSVRLAIAQLMAGQGHSDDAERQIALAQLEGDAGDTSPPSGGQFIAAADVFRSMHEYELSQSYLQRAKAAGAPDSEVRIGLANNYLALGDTARAQAELSAVSASTDSAPDYQYLLAEANVYRQQHHDAQALTSFAQASNAAGEDQTAQQALLQAGADEGLRITPILSVLSDFSVEPIFEDSTVYVLDSKLDAAFPVPGSDITLLPPPRSSLETQWTNAYHLHLGHLPTTSGFFQVRNARGQISVPGTNSIVSRATTDYTFNVGLNPTINIGSNVLTFNSGVQATIRRDSESPIAMNQNLFRIFTYMSTSSFFNAVSMNGYFLRESGPFTESNLHSQAISGAIDFRVGAPWGKTALVVGWGSNDQQFSPVHFEDYLTSSYIGVERRFGERLTVKAVAEDLRSWRVVGTKSGIAQNLRPAGTVDFTPNHNWDLQFSTAYSSTRGFHAYDNIQNGFSISYARPFHRKFNDDSGTVVLQYPIRFSAGIQQETFFNFTGGNNQQLRPYVRISLF